MFSHHHFVSRRPIPELLQLQNRRLVAAVSAKSIRGSSCMCVVLWKASPSRGLILGSARRCQPGTALPARAAACLQSCRRDSSASPAPGGASSLSDWQRPETVTWVLISALPFLADLYHYPSGQCWCSQSSCGSVSDSILLKCSQNISWFLFMWICFFICSLQAKKWEVPWESYWNLLLWEYSACSELSWNDSLLPRNKTCHLSDLSWENVFGNAGQRDCMSSMHKALMVLYQCAKKTCKWLCIEYTFTDSYIRRGRHLKPLVM